MMNYSNRGVFKQIILMLLALAMIVYAPGITVFNVICGCIGKQEISFLEFIDSCKAEKEHIHSSAPKVNCNAITKCCLALAQNFNEPVSCCSFEISEGDIRGADDHLFKKDCCKGKTKLFQLDESNSSISKIEIPAIAATIPVIASLYVFIISNEIINTTPYTALLYKPDIPIKTGKKLLIEYHTWLN